jgi:hypothetical protein
LQRISGYPKGCYNAVVFNQRCRSCKKLGNLTLDKEAYVDRVAYRLKNWAAIEMESPNFNSKKGLPPDSTLCESCKRGVCQKKNDWEYR